jgi:xylan 1,4-beta-xylosidase
MFRLRNPANGAANDNPREGRYYVQAYYAGLRPAGVVLAKINYDWKELARTEPPLVPGQWYRLRIEAAADTYRVYLGDATAPAITFTDTLPYPFIAGKVGLRGENAQGYFGNFKVSPLTPPIK